MDKMLTQHDSLSEPSKSGPRRFPEATKRIRNKVPASPIRAVSGMEEKYQRIMGEIKELESAEYDWVGREGFKMAEDYYRDRMNHLKSTLWALEKSIRQFDPKWTRKALMTPKRTNLTRPLGKRNTLQDALVQILRRATQPLTIPELVLNVGAKLGLKTRTHDQRAVLYRRLYGSLRRYYDKGFVDCIDCDGSPNKWWAVEPTSQAERGLTVQ
jgi:hypothetical protein